MTGTKLAKVITVQQHDPCIGHVIYTLLSEALPKIAYNYCTCAKNATIVCDVVHTQ